MLSFEGGTLLLRETGTVLRSRDVSHRGPVWFWCIIHVPVLVVIPVLKKRELLFDTPSYLNLYIYIYIYMYIMIRETGVLSQVESYQRLKKWYLMPHCLKLTIIRHGSMVKWSNPGNGVAASSTPQCSSYWKGSLQVTLDHMYVNNTNCDS